MSYTVTLNLTSCTSSNTQTTVEDGASYSTIISADGVLRIIIGSCKLWIGGVASDAYIEKINDKQRRIYIPSVTGDIRINASSNTTDRYTTESFLRRNGTDKVDYSFSSSATFTSSYDEIRQIYVNVVRLLSGSALSNYINTTNPSATELVGKIGMHGKSNYGVKKSKVDNGTLDMGYNCIGCINTNKTTQYYGRYGNMHFSDIVTDINGDEWYKTAYYTYNDIVSGWNTGYSIGATGQITYDKCAMNISGYGVLGVTLGLDDSIFEQYTEAPPSITVTNNLTNCSNNNSSSTFPIGGTYNATVTASSANDYEFDASNVSVTMGNTSITPTFASDNKSFTISIANVTDSIVITASADRYYSIDTHDFTHSTNSNSMTRIKENSTYTTICSADSGYFYDGHTYDSSAHTCIVWNTDSNTANIVYNDTHTIATVTISNVHDDIVLHSQATQVGATVTNNLTHCSTNNSATIVSRDNYFYTAVLTCDSGYQFNPSNFSDFTIMADNVSLYNSSHSNTVTFSNNNTVATIDTRGYGAMATYGIYNLVITARAIPISGYTITNNLTNASTNNSSTTVQDGSSYSATITATSGYYFETSNVTVMMGNTSITPTFASDNKSFTISIASATDDIVITASATQIPIVYHTVTNTLTNASNSNPSTQVEENTSYNATVTATSGYKFRTQNVSVTMGGTTITPTFASDAKSFTISIASVTDDIVITASAILIPTYTITNNLTNCSNDNATTSILEGDSYSATITADSGYYFEHNNVSVTVGSTTVTPTFASDDKSFTISIARVSGNITITSSATYIPQEFTVTNTLTNATTNNPSATVVESTTYSATITADSGYYFEHNNVSVTVGSTTITPTFASDDKSFTISIPNVDGNISVTASATQIPIVYHTVTNTLTHCTNSNSATQVEDNTSYSATITADTDYYFEHNNVSVTVGSTTVTPTFASDDKSFTISIANVDDDIAIVASASVVPIPTVFTVTNNLIHCTNSNTATTVQSGDNYNGLLNAESGGYEFDLNDVSVMMGNTSIPVEYFGQTHKYVRFSIASVTDNIVITARARIPMPVVDDFGTCYIYNPTVSEIEDVMANTTDNHYQNRTMDILRLYRTYVTIPVKSTKSHVILGTWDTQVDSDVVSQQYIEVNCGTVTLAEVAENVIDYSPFTALQIYLPFIGIKDLDVDVYRNKSVTLKYVFDVMSGKAVALLSINGKVYNQFECDIADEIPISGLETHEYAFGNAVNRYLTTAKVTDGSNVNALTLANNYPYFIITQNVGYAPDSDIDGVSNYVATTLSNVTGLVKVRNIHLETKATNSEKREIELLLMQGVKIKENL